MRSFTGMDSRPVVRAAGLLIGQGHRTIERAAAGAVAVPPETPA